MYCVCIFYSSNELITFISTDNSFVKMTAYCLNPILVLHLWAMVVLQSIITLIPDVLSIKILLSYFVCSSSSTSSYLCFLWFELYFVVMSHKFLWSNASYICFSFNHSIPSLSIILSIPFLSYVFLLILTIFI